MKGYGVYCENELIAWFESGNVAYWFKNEQETAYDHDCIVKPIEISVNSEIKE